MEENRINETKNYIETKRDLAEEKDKPTQNSDQTPAEPAQSNEEPGKCFLQLNFLLKCFEYNSRVRVFIK